MDTEEDKKRELFLFCLAKAQEEFTAQLRSGTYRSAVNYLTERGINQQIQEEFALGYAGSVKDLIAALKKSGIKEKEHSDWRWNPKREGTRSYLPIHGTNNFSPHGPERRHCRIRRAGYRYLVSSKVHKLS